MQVSIHYINYIFDTLDTYSPKHPINILGNFPLKKNVKKSMVVSPS